MKKALLSLLTLILMGLLVLGSTAEAAPERTKSKPKRSQAKKGSGLSTDISFEGSTVKGKYQFADEAIARVEDEKLLEDLLGVRKHFKDRLENETMRH